MLHINLLLYVADFSFRNKTLIKSAKCSINIRNFYYLYSKYIHAEYWLDFIDRMAFIENEYVHKDLSEIPSKKWIHCHFLSVVKISLSSLRISTVNTLNAYYTYTYLVPISGTYNVGPTCSDTTKKARTYNSCQNQNHKYQIFICTVCIQHVHCVQFSYISHR